MKKLLFPFFLLACMSAFSQTISTFDDLVLDTGLKYWNGSDYSKGFKSGNAKFINEYDSAFGGYWSGFAVSGLMDTTRKGWPNEYGVISGKGYQNSNQWGVCYVADASWIILQGKAAGKSVAGFWINNGTYPYHSMKNGDPFSKKFGGAQRNDTDWFKLQITAYPNLRTKDFYLADYRFADSTQDYIVKDWTWVDLSVLGNVDSLKFVLYSTDFDTSLQIINTPAYFHMDNLITWEYPSGVEEINTLFFYPNPASGSVQLSHGKPGDLIEIYSIQGGQMQSRYSLQSNQIETDQWSPGLYLVKISGEKVYQGKILIQH